MNGVIETATGDLIRKGFSDFENDGTFNSGTETYKTDIPDAALIKKVYGGDFTRWNGSNYVTISRTALVLKERGIICAEALIEAEQVTQKPRILDGLDNHSTIALCLDAFDYIGASSRLEKAVADGDLLTADRTLIESKFPTGWNS